VADDTAENRTLLVKLLDAGRFDVREATNGQEAVEVWASWQPDLIWMDVRMPVMDGVEAMRRIREEECEAWEWAHGDRGADGRGVRARPGAHHGGRMRRLRDEAVPRATIFEKLAERLGVGFVYREAEQGWCARGRVGAGPEPAGGLPGEWIGELRLALEQGDDQARLEVVDRIRARDEPLAGEVRKALKSYRFRRAPRTDREDSELTAWDVPVVDHHLYSAPNNLE
jgi:hypothetical protein